MTLIKRVKGFGPALLDITYRLPDNPSVLSYFWHGFEDHYPDFPRTKRLLRHWKDNIEGSLYCVTLDHVYLPRPVPILSIDGEPLSLIAPCITPIQYN